MPIITRPDPHVYLAQDLRIQQCYVNILNTAGKICKLLLLAYKVRARACPKLLFLECARPKLLFLECPVVFKESIIMYCHNLWTYSYLIYTAPMAPSNCVTGTLRSKEYACISKVCHLLWPTVYGW
jgi:hypothetical protein